MSIEHRPQRYPDPPKIQAGDSPPVTDEERPDWQQAWDQPFVVVSLCREDLRGMLSDEQIANLSDSEMKQMADRLSDALREIGGYWESLEFVVGLVTQQSRE
jgi:hypothetical protein